MTILDDIDELERTLYPHRRGREQGTAWHRPRYQVDEHLARLDFEARLSTGQATLSDWLEARHKVWQA